MKRFSNISFFLYTFLYTILPFSFSCVGPAEPEHGLVKNMSVVVNTAEAFTYSLRGEGYSFEESYDLKLALADGQTFSTTLVVTDFKGTDTTTVQVSDENGTLVHDYMLTGNVVKVETGGTIWPKKAFIKGTNFSGILGLVIARE